MGLTQAHGLKAPMLRSGTYAVQRATAVGARIPRACVQIARRFLRVVLRLLQGRTNPAPLRAHQSPQVRLRM